MYYFNGTIKIFQDRCCRADATGGGAGRVLQRMVRKQIKMFRCAPGSFLATPVHRQVAWKEARATSACTAVVKSDPGARTTDLKGGAYQ